MMAGTPEKPLHIGLVCESYPPYPCGGVGHRTANLAEALVKHGHRVTVFGVHPRNRGLNGDQSEERNGVQVRRLVPAPKWMRFRPGILWDRLRVAALIRAEHRRHPFDLVEYTDSYGWATFRPARTFQTSIRMEGTLLLYDQFLGANSHPIYYWMERRSLQRVDHLSAVSDYVGRETMSVAGLTQSYQVIYNAIDTDLFKPSDDVQREPGLIVFVNAISGRKGAPELLAAMNHVCADVPHARLLLVGSPSPSTLNGRPYTETLLEAVDSKFHHRITFAGQLDREREIVPLLQRASVCCFPSRIEACPLAPMEAMATGAPTIFSDIGPGHEIIEPGVSGLLCNPTDPKDVAAKICQVLTDDALAVRLGSGGRARIVSRFAMKDWARLNTEYYRACVRGASTDDHDPAS